MPRTTGIGYRVEFPKPTLGHTAASGAELDAILYDYYQKGGNLRDVRIHAVARIFSGETFVMTARVKPPAEGK